MEDYKAQYYNEALLHYGVKGMRWGVRKARDTVKNQIKSTNKKRRNRKVKKINKQISKLEKQKSKQQAWIKKKQARYGRIYMHNYIDPSVTEGKIKASKVKRSSIKNGDPKRVTKLKTQKQVLQNYIKKKDKEFDKGGHIPPRELKEYQNVYSSLRRVNKSLEKQKKKKKKKQ